MEIYTYRENNGDANLTVRLEYCAYRWLSFFEGTETKLWSSATLHVWAVDIMAMLVKLVLSTVKWRLIYGDISPGQRGSNALQWSQSSYSPPKMAFLPLMRGIEPQTKRFKVHTNYTRTNLPLLNNMD